MAAYLTVYGLSIVGLLFSVFYRLSSAYYFVIAILVLFSALRFQVGVDYNSYSELFVQIVSHESEIFEIGNLYWIDFFYGLGGSNLVFASYSVVTLILIGRSLDVLSSSREVSLIVFILMTVFYLSTFNHVRQWFSISIVMFAFSLLSLNNRKTSLVCFMMAPLFHLSVIPLVLLGVLLVYRVNAQFIKIIIFSGVLIGVYGVELIEYTKYHIYIGGFGVFYPIYAVVTVFLAVQWYIFNSFGLSHSSYNGYILNMLLMAFFAASVVVSIVSPPFLHGFRFLESFFWIELLVIPVLVNVLGKEIKVMGLLVFYLLLLTYNFRVLFKYGDMYMLTPYQTILG